MAVKREKGYEYKGWKLGEEVRFKEDNTNYNIIGFDEREEFRSIAINRNYCNKNIKSSCTVTSYIDNDSNCFEWVSENEIEKIENTVNKEQEQLTDVLVLEYQEVFDMVAVRIVYQNEDVLKRGEFEDKEIGVYSRHIPLFPDEKTFLNIRGVRRDYDNQIMIVFKEEAEIIKEKVRKINEKYGVKNNWRAKEGELYYYITPEIKQNPYHENNYGIDDILYQNGNYFKTKEQAEEASRRIKELLKNYHEEIGE